MDSWSDLLIALPAFWGAVLSTLIFVKDLRRERSVLRVKARKVLIGGPGEVRWCISVSAINTGKISIRLASVELGLPDGQKYVQLRPILSPPLPYELAPRQSYTYEFDEEEFRAAAREAGLSGRISVVPSVTDQIENRYEGKTYEVEV